MDQVSFYIQIHKTLVMKEGALKQRDDLREESGNHERFKYI